MKIFKITYLFIFIFLVLNFSIYAEDVIPNNVINDIKNIYITNGFDPDIAFENSDNTIFKSKSLKKNTSITHLSKRKSATLLMRDLSSYASKQNTNLKRILKNKFKLYRPDQSNDPYYYGNDVNINTDIKTYKTEHFLLHYVVKTGNTHNIKYSIDTIATFGLNFETCWTTLNKLGFIKPIKDNDGLIDIYFENISNTAFAYALLDNDTELQSSGYILLDNDYIGHSGGDVTSYNLYSYIKILFSHEYFHLIEFSYNSQCEKWIAESCATWIEDIADNGNNSYQYFLPTFFNNPNFSLEFFIEDGDYYDYSYGACVFPRYLYNKHGLNVLIRMWEYMRDNPAVNMDGIAITALKNTLPEKGLNFSDVLGDFEVACYFVDTNYSNDFANKYYKDEEARQFGITRKISGEATFPFSKYKITTNQPYGLGAYYLLIKPKYDLSSMKLNFVGDTTAVVWGGKIIKFKNDNSVEIDNFKFSDKSNATIQIDSFGSIYSKAILIPYVSDGNKNTQYTFLITNADSTAPSPITNFSMKNMNDSKVEMSWTNPTDNDFAGVLITRNDSTQISDVLDTTKNIIVYRNNTNSYIDRGLYSKKTYYYKIFTYDSSLNYSTGVGNNIYIIDTSPPIKISSKELIAKDDKSDGRINLSWMNYLPPQDIESYIVYYDTTDFTIISTQKSVTIDSKNKTYQLENLTNNQIYYFAVVPVDKDNNANNSVQTVSMRPTKDIEPPISITQLKGVPGGSEGKIKLDWSSYPAPKDLAYYKIYVLSEFQKTIDVKNIKNYDSTTEKFYYKSGLTNNILYFFAVIPVDIYKNENTIATVIKAIPQEYNNFSIQMNVSNQNIYIDGNYAYTGKYLNTTSNGVKLDFKEIAKKHFLSIQSKNGTYLDYYQTFDLTTNYPTIEIKLSPHQATKYSSPEILIPQFNGKLTSPFVVDWNNDGKKDLLLGNESGEIFIYLNTNTDASPVLGNPIPINIGNVPINVGAEAVPFVVDWNNDSQKDLLIGNKDGKIYLFENIGSDDSPVFSDSTIIFSYDKNITPYVIDLNLDRKKDIVFGCKNGTINYILNTNTDENPNLSATPVKINSISVENYSAPFFANWDNKNQIDLLIGSENIGMQIYYNAETRKLMDFLSTSTTAPFISSNKTRIKPFIVDWNNDGLLDVIIGEENGNISIYYGKKTNPVTPSGSSKKKICIISKSINNINNLTKTRDEILLNSFSGKIITNLYYKISSFITGDSRESYYSCFLALNMLIILIIIILRNGKQIRT